MAYQAKNKALLPVQIESQTQTISSQEEITTLLSTISYLKIKEKIFSGDDILINGDLIIDDPKETDKKIKLNTALLLRYTDNEFMVKKIKIENQNTLNAIMKEVLSKARYSLGDMHEYVNQNFGFYDKSSQTDVADILCNQIKNKISTDPEIQIRTCTTDELALSKATENTTTTYDIRFSNYAIISVTISDQAIQTAIDERLKNISTNEVNFVDVVDSIMKYKIPQASTAE